MREQQQHLERVIYAALSSDTSSRREWALVERNGFHSIAGRTSLDVWERPAEEMKKKLLQQQYESWSPPPPRRLS